MEVRLGMDEVCTQSEFSISSLTSSNYLDAAQTIQLIGLSAYMPNRAAVPLARKDTHAFPQFATPQL
jgi:hypothetical protein